MQPQPGRAGGVLVTLGILGLVFGVLAAGGGLAGLLVGAAVAQGGLLLLVAGVIVRACERVEWRLLQLGELLDERLPEPGREAAEGAPGRDAGTGGPRPGGGFAAPVRSPAELRRNRRLDLVILAVVGLAAAAIFAAWLAGVGPEGR